MESQEYRDYLSSPVPETLISGLLIESRMWGIQGSGNQEPWPLETYLVLQGLKCGSRGNSYDAIVLHAFAVDSQSSIQSN